MLPWVDQQLTPRLNAEERTEEILMVFLSLHEDIGAFGNHFGYQLMHRYRMVRLQQSVISVRHRHNPGTVPAAVAVEEDVHAAARGTRAAKLSMPVLDVSVKLLDHAWERSFNGIPSFVSNSGFDVRDTQ